MPEKLKRRRGRPSRALGVPVDGAGALSVRLSAEFYDWVKSAAVARDVSMGDIVAAALAQLRDRDGRDNAAMLAVAADAQAHRVQMLSDARASKHAADSWGGVLPALTLPMASNLHPTMPNWSFFYGHPDRVRMVTVISWASLRLASAGYLLPADLIAEFGVTRGTALIWLAVLARVQYHFGDVYQDKWKRHTGAGSPSGVLLLRGSLAEQENVARWQEDAGARMERATQQERHAAAMARMHGDDV